jgi:hypothetical protein
MIKKKKKIGILNTPILIVVVETYWNIAGTATPRTVVSVYYMSMAWLQVEDLTRHFLHQLYLLP